MDWMIPSNFKFQFHFDFNFNFQFQLNPPSQPDGLVDPPPSHRPSKEDFSQAGGWEVPAFLLWSYVLIVLLYYWLTSYLACIIFVAGLERRKTKTLFPKLAAMWRAVRPLESGKSTLSGQNLSTKLVTHKFVLFPRKWPRIDARKIVSKKNLAPAAMRRVAAFLSPSATAVWRRDPPCPPYWQFTASLGDQSFLRFCDLI